MSEARRVALVTGGSRGIGQGIAVELARAGHDVAFTYNRSPQGAEATAKQVAEAGGRAHAIQCDVGSYEAVEACVSECIETLGGLNVVVNNAGITRDQLILRMKPEDFDAVIETNLRGTWNVCRIAARPLLKARWGRIVNLSSVVAAMGNAGQSNYAASKGGIEALTRSLARELASRNITVNAVAPGFIETDMTEAVSEDVKAAMSAQIPLGRFGRVEDVAHAVRFLVSDDAEYITGQVIAVNGGMD